jgi:hypothetical protein
MMNKKNNLDIESKIIDIVAASLPERIEADDVAIFFDMITHADCGLNWLFTGSLDKEGMLFSIEKKYNHGDVVASLSLALDALQYVVKQNCAITYTLQNAYKRIERTIKSDDGRAEGRRRRKENVDARHKIISEAVENAMGKNKKMSLTAARLFVAEQQQISLDSVRRASRDVKPRKKSQK